MFYEIYFIENCKDIFKEELNLYKFVLDIFYWELQRSI